MEICISCDTMQSVGDRSAIVHGFLFLCPILAGIKRYEEQSGADSYFDGQMWLPLHSFDHNWGKIDFYDHNQSKLKKDQKERMRRIQGTIETEWWVAQQSRMLVLLQLVYHW